MWLGRESAGCRVLSAESRGSVLRQLVAFGGIGQAAKLVDLRRSQRRSQQMQRANTELKSFKAKASALVSAYVVGFVLFRGVPAWLAHRRIGRLNGVDHSPTCRFIGWPIL